MLAEQGQNCIRCALLTVQGLVAGHGLNRKSPALWLGFSDFRLSGSGLYLRVRNAIDATDNDMRSESITPSRPRAISLWGDNLFDRPSRDADQQVFAFNLHPLLVLPWRLKLVTFPIFDFQALTLILLRRYVPHLQFLSASAWANQCHARLIGGVRKAAQGAKQAYG